MADGQFLTPLRLEDTDGEKWILLENLVYKTEKGEILTAPAGFVTDLASIPRPIWVFLAPSGPYNEAAVIHDAAYKHQLLPRLWERREADALFRECMKALGVGWFRRQVMWASVRSFGWVPHEGPERV